MSPVQRIIARFRERFPTGKEETWNWMAQVIADETKVVRKPKQADMSDEEWVASLEGDAAFKGLNVRAEIARCSVWYRQNVSKTGAPTRRRILNWLLKCERVADLKAMGAQHATGLRPPPPAGPKDWEAWLRTELLTLSDDHPAWSQLQAALNCRSFHMMPRSFQERCIKSSE